MIKKLYTKYWSVCTHVGILVRSKYEGESIIPLIFTTKNEAQQVMREAISLGHKDAHVRRSEILTFEKENALH